MTSITIVELTEDGSDQRVWGVEDFKGLPLGVIRTSETAETPRYHVASITGNYVSARTYEQAVGLIRDWAGVKTVIEFEGTSTQMDRAGKVVRKWARIDGEIVEVEFKEPAP